MRAWNKGLKTGIVPKTAFKKGRTAWNKGLKRTWNVSTEFKKGYIPWNLGKDNGGYDAIHGWIRKKLGSPSICEDCKTNKSKVYDWANISREYKRILSDWKRLCRKCHVNYDDSVNKSWKVRKKIFKRNKTGQFLK